MKKLVSLIVVAAFSGCALLPPKTGVAPTAEQQKIATGLQAFATEIRKAENAAWTPQQFATDLSVVCAVLPAAAPYATVAETAYSAALVGGNLSIKAGESLATRYDS